MSAGCCISASNLQLHLGLAGTAISHTALSQTCCLSLQAGKDCNEPILYEFSKQALRDAGAFHDVPPFAAIASNEYDLSVGR